MAESHADLAMSNVWFEDASQLPVSPAGVWESTPDWSPIRRYVDGIGDIAAASMTTIGYENGVLVLQSESGTWFCQAGRERLDERPRSEINPDGSLAPEVQLTASGSDPESVAVECEALRTEYQNGG